MSRLWNINAVTLNFNVTTLLFFFFYVFLTLVDVATFDADVATLLSQCHDIEVVF